MTGLGAAAGMPGAVVLRTEQRMARMVGYARAACATFVIIPLFGWGDLRHPWIAVLIVVTTGAEASWFVRQVWRQPGRLARRLVLTDVAFCVVLMLVGSRAAEPDDRNKIMTELVPFSLVAPAGVGFSIGVSAVALGAVATLMVAWSLAVLPDVSLKLGSDLLGFALWYVVALLIARELRTLSAATAAAQDAAAAAGRLAIEQEKEAESLRHREITHREIHDYLLPIVDHVAASGTPSPAIVREARRGAQRARRIIMDPRGMHPSGKHPSGKHPSGMDPRPLDPDGSTTPEAAENSFETMMSAVVDTFTDEGLALVPFLAIHGDPPEQVRETVVAATREALRNVVRHSGSLTDGATDDVQLFVEADSDAVLVVVRDRGVGFDPDTVVAGGGLAGTYAAVHRHGGETLITGRPGNGVKVTIRWPADRGGPGNGEGTVP